MASPRPGHEEQELPRLLVGTGNRHKVAEIAAILDGLPLRVVGAEALGRELSVEEDGDSFEANAGLKAAAYARAAMESPPPRPRWVLADDSGLCVDALGGQPGVQSARYAGAAGADRAATDAANNAKLLGALAGVPPERRGARFVCALALCEVPSPATLPAEPLRPLLTVRGECPGRILDAARGGGGFGYDPLFLDPESGRSFAELPAPEKNRRSHRARALARLREKLASLLAES
jgi:XTP/dITP diphosphohydrolase